MEKSRNLGDLRAVCARYFFMTLQSYLDPLDGARFLSGIARTLLPVIERTGVASASEVNISTLESRLVEETVAAGSVMLAPRRVDGMAHPDKPSPRPGSSSS
jgi:hypothetical protein